MSIVPETSPSVNPIADAVRRATVAARRLLRRKSIEPTSTMIIATIQNRRDPDVAEAAGSHIARREARR